MKKTKEKRVRFRVKLPKSLYRAGKKIAKRRGFDDVGKWASALVIADLARKARRKKPAIGVQAGPA